MFAIAYIILCSTPCGITGLGSAELLAVKSSLLRAQRLSASKVWSVCSNRYDCTQSAIRAQRLSASKVWSDGLGLFPLAQIHSAQRLSASKVWSAPCLLRHDCPTNSAQRLSASKVWSGR